MVRGMEWGRYGEEGGVSHSRVHKVPEVDNKDWNKGGGVGGGLVEWRSHLGAFTVGHS